MAGRRYSIRFSVAFLVSVSLVLCTALAVSMTYMGSRQGTHILLRHVMEGVKQTFREKTFRYFNDATLTLESISELHRNNILANQPFERIMGYSRTILDRHPHFSSIYYGDIDGNMVMLKRMPDGTKSIRSLVRGETEAVTVWRHDNAAWGDTFAETHQPLDAAYDPRERPWYKAAIDREAVAWTDVYVFHTDGAPGITCSVPMFHPESGKLTHVIAVDIRLDDLSLFLGENNLEGLTVVVLNAKNEVIGLPIEPGSSRQATLDALFKRDANGDYVLRTMEESAGSGTPFGKLWSSFKSALAARPAGDQDIFEFGGGLNRHLGLSYSIRDESPWDWTVFVMAPERVYMSDVRQRVMVSIVASIMILIASLLLALLISNRITLPLALLARDMAKVEKFDLENQTKILSRILEVNNISVAFENMKTGLRSFGKYAPADLVRSLIREGEEATLGGEKRDVTIFFTDIENFTTIAGRTDPDALVAQLGEYFSAMSEVIHRNGGTVDKFIGDAVMAFWGAPKPVADHAAAACTAALECSAKIGELHRRWEKEGKPLFRTRFGLASGEVIVGNIGSEDRLNYTAIGDTVNLAARLEAENKHHETRIIISERTNELIAGRFETRSLGPLTIKGMTNEITAFELVRKL